MSVIIKSHARRVHLKKMSIDDVREEIREEVRAAVKTLYGEEV